MSRVLSKADGVILIDLARKAINSVFSGDDLSLDDSMKKKFSKPNGVFISLKKYGKLRGCIGYVRSQRPLYDAVVSAAKSAAFQDTRFLPLSREEFDKVELEISLLTEPVMLSKNDKNDLSILKNITVGKDGILIKNNNFSGLFLPHTASGLNWSSEELLKYACNKFGLTETAWQDSDSKLYKFRAQVFSDAML